MGKKAITNCEKSVILGVTIHAPHTDFSRIDGFYTAVGKTDHQRALFIYTQGMAITFFFAPDQDHMLMQSHAVPALGIQHGGHIQ